LPQEGLEKALPEVCYLPHHMDTLTGKIDTLSISVFEEISVSEIIVVELLVLRLITWRGRQEDAPPLVSIDEYRRALGDLRSSDEKVAQRLGYLEAFCRNIIRLELETYANKAKKGGNP